MSGGGRAFGPVKSVLTVLAVTAILEMCGVNLTPPLLGLAIPAIVVGCVGAMVGLEDVPRTCFKAAIGLVTLALAAPALGSVLRAVLLNRYVEGAACIVVAVAMGLAVLWVYAKAAEIAPSEHKKPHRAAVRERVALAQPLAEPPLARPRAALSDDEVGVGQHL